MFLFVVDAVLQLQLVFKAAALEGELGELEVQGADGDLDLQGAVVELGEAFAVRGGCVALAEVDIGHAVVKFLLCHDCDVFVGLMIVCFSGLSRFSIAFLWAFRGLSA